MLANNAAINLLGGSITTTAGPAAHGLQATVGIDGKVTADGVIVIATGGGIHVGDGATADFKNGAVSSVGIGVDTFAAGKAIVTNSTIATTGSGAFGLFATDAGSLITADTVTIATSGASAHGTAVGNGGTLLVTNGNVAATGPGASGLFLAGPAGSTQSAT